MTPVPKAPKNPEEPASTRGLSGFVINTHVFSDVWLDTVVTKIREPRSAADAATIPGCHVKSLECATTGAEFPKHFGKIQSYRAASKTDPGRVIVCCKYRPPDEKPYVWCGTVAEYEETWESD